MTHIFFGSFLNKFDVNLHVFFVVSDSMVFSLSKIIVVSFFVFFSEEIK